MRSKVLAQIAAFAVLALGGSAQVMATELIVNGNFELNNFSGASGVGSGVSGTNYQAGYGPWGTNQVDGWTISGYTFSYAPGTADSFSNGAANGDGGVVVMHGPGTDAANGLTATSPLGGNFIAADGGSEMVNGSLVNYAGSLSQTVSGLTVGQAYTLSFYWAAGQQYGYSGDTTEQWQVTLGNDVNYFTTSVANPSHGFQPWRQENVTFTAQNTSELLTFLAHGTPNGQPPFSFLDGVSLRAAVPEPATWMTMLMGFGLIGGLLRTRKSDDRRALRMQIV